MVGSEMKVEDEVSTGMEVKTEEEAGAGSSRLDDEGAAKNAAERLVDAEATEEENGTSTVADG